MRWWWRKRRIDPEPEARPDRRPTLTEIMIRRRRLDEQIASFRAFERRLSTQLHDALRTERLDYAREIAARRLAVRARLEEVLRRRYWVGLEEDRARSTYGASTAVASPAV